jgi:predicted HTH transcriptional regulator
MKSRETTTLALMVAALRPVEMTERPCGMANAQGGIVIIGVKDAVHEIVGVPDNRIGETLDVPLRAPGKWTSLFRRTIHHRRNGASSPLEKTGLSRSDF